jgi:hypothetical protein
MDREKRARESIAANSIRPQKRVTAHIMRVTANDALGCLEDVFVTIWRAQTTVEGVRAVEAECETFRSRRAEGIGMLTIVEAHTPMPDAPARQALAALLQNGGAFIKASAVVFDGNSFRASAVRSVATGLTLLAKQPFPHKFFVDPGEALRFLDTSLPAGVGRADPARRLAALDELRQRIAGREPPPRS